MLCLLCKEDRKLIEAHIIPRSFHRLNPTERQPARLTTNVAGRYAQKIPKGVYDREIVCEDCERRFSPWDDYAAELFIERWPQFEQLLHGNILIGYKLSRYDYTRLKLFFVSLLWRASVSKHAMFEKISVGIHEEHLRAAILSENPGTLHFYTPLLQAFDSTEVGMLDPQPEQLQGIEFIRFYVGHVIAWIKVGSQSLPENLEPLALKPAEPLILAKKDFLHSPERRIMRNLALADQAKKSKS